MSCSYSSYRDIQLFRCPGAPRPACPICAVPPRDAWQMHEALDLSDGNHFDVFEFFLLRCLFGFLFSEQGAERTGLMNKHFDITFKFLGDVQGNAHFRR